MSYKDELKIRLRRLGLSNYEIKAYLTLLKYGSLTSTELVKKSGIPQPRIYDTIHRLEEKGLVLVAEGYPRKYRAEDPKTALKRLCDRIKRRVEEDYRVAVKLIENIEMEKEKVTEDIWRIVGHRKIIEKIKSIIGMAKYEVLVSIYNTHLPELTETLKRCSERGTSICLIIYRTYEGKLDRKKLAFIDEIRESTIKGLGPVIIIVDRAHALFVTNWKEPREDVVGFYTNNSLLMKLLTDYYLSKLRRLTVLKHYILGTRILSRSFVNLIRAIEMIDNAKSRNAKVRVKVIGKSIKNGKRVEVEGVPEETFTDFMAGITRITIRTDDGKLLSIGGWGAIFEDIEAEVVKVTVEIPSISSHNS